jgi:predicted nucleotidyltransferase component of viral defense system
MKLHLQKDLFKQAIEITAFELSIDPIYIEKDYWITLALKLIYKNKIGEETIFKGGTSLSKCYNYIKRFSEDIDLVVVRNNGETDTQLNKKIRQISKTLEAILPEINIEGLTSKHGMLRKTVHQYTKMFAGNFGQVRDVIIVEASCLGYFEPYENKFISSFVSSMMLQKEQSELIAEYEMESFEVLVLKPQRTLCEKIMSLVRFSNSKNPIVDLQKKVRHCYNLHYLLNDKEIKRFFNGDEFETMMIKVAKDDVKSYKSGNEWLALHPKDALLFSDTVNVWKQLKRVYETEFKNLVYDNFLAENEIEQTLLTISKRLKKMQWNVKV